MSGAAARLRVEWRAGRLRKSDARASLKNDHCHQRTGQDLARSRPSPILRAPLGVEEQHLAVRHVSQWESPPRNACRTIYSRRTAAA
jgi:hypothetical protein